MNQATKGLFAGIVIGMGFATVLPSIAAGFNTYMKGSKVITQKGAYAYVNDLPDANCMVDPLSPVIAKELQIWCQ